MDTHSMHNPKYKEILKLHSMLEEAGIPHDFMPDMDGYTIKYPQFVNFTCSVVEHEYSYGHGQDLLEMMGLLTEYERTMSSDNVIGSLTADDVFARIKTHYKLQRKVQESEE